MTFRTIVADPPWEQKAGPLRAGVGEGFVFDGAQVSQDESDVCLIPRNHERGRADG